MRTEEISSLFLVVCVGCGTRANGDGGSAGTAGTAAASSTGASVTGQGPGGSGSNGGGSDVTGTSAASTTSGDSGGLACGPGTHEEDGLCVPDEDMRPEGWCVPVVLGDPIQVDEYNVFSKTIGAGAIAWTGSEYLVLLAETSGQATKLVLRSVGTDGTVSAPSTVLQGAPLSGVEKPAHVALRPCGAGYCGHAGNDKTVTNGSEAGAVFLLDGAGSLAWTTARPAGDFAALVSTGQHGLLVYAKKGWKLDPQGPTLVEVAGFAPAGNKDFVAASAFPDGSIVTLEHDDQAAEYAPVARTWTAEGAPVAGPVPIGAGLANPKAFDVVATMDGVVVAVGAFDQDVGIYTQGFTQDLVARGLHYVDFSPTRLGTTDAFAILVATVPKWSAFAIDTFGRPNESAGGKPLPLPLPAGGGISTFESRFAPEDIDRLAWLTYSSTADGAQILVLRLGCE